MDAPEDDCFLDVRELRGHIRETVHHGHREVGLYSAGLGNCGATLTDNNVSEFVAIALHRVGEAMQDC